MIGDLNEMCGVPLGGTRTPVAIPINMAGLEGYRRAAHTTVNLHEMTDEQLDVLVSVSDRGEGWRWARSLARLLAGLSPRPWRFPSERPPAERSLADHVKGLQTAMGVEADGIIGNKTMMALIKFGLVRQ